MEWSTLAHIPMLALTRLLHQSQYYPLNSSQGKTTRAEHVTKQTLKLSHPPWHVLPLKLTLGNQQLCHHCSYNMALSSSPDTAYRTSLAESTVFQTLFIHSGGHTYSISNTENQSLWSLDLFLSPQREGFSMSRIYQFRTIATKHKWPLNT